MLSFGDADVKGSWTRAHRHGQVLRLWLRLQRLMRRGMVVLVMVDVHVVHRLPVRGRRMLMLDRLLQRLTRDRRRRRRWGLPDSRVLPEVRMQVLHSSKASFGNAMA